MLPLLPQLEKDPLPRMSAAPAELLYHSNKSIKDEQTVSGVLKSSLSYSHSYPLYLLTSMVSGGRKMQLFPFYESSNNGDREDICTRK